eukprot:3233624-Prymnesium_polylepis.1
MMRRCSRGRRALPPCAPHKTARRTHTSCRRAGSRRIQQPSALSPPPPPPPPRQPGVALLHRATPTSRAPATPQTAR